MVAGAACAADSEADADGVELDGVDAGVVPGFAFEPLWASFGALAGGSNATGLCAL